MALKGIDSLPSFSAIYFSLLDNFSLSVSKTWPSSSLIKSALISCTSFFFVDGEDWNYSPPEIDRFFVPNGLLFLNKLTAITDGISFSVYAPIYGFFWF